MVDDRRLGATLRPVHEQGNEGPRLGRGASDRSVKPDALLREFVLFGYVEKTQAVSKQASSTPCPLAILQRITHCVSGRTQCASLRCPQYFGRPARP